MSPLMLAADVLLVALAASAWLVSLATPRVLAACARYAPADRSRLLLRWALAPWLLAWCAVLLPLMPTLMVSELGLLDWCQWRHGGDARTCPMHGVAANPNALMTLLLLLLGVLVLLQLWRTGRALIAGLRAARCLQHACSAQIQLDAQRIGVVDSAQPLALSLAWPRPQILVSASVEQQLARVELQALVAHERAHLERRDGYWRLLLVVSSAILLPHARDRLRAEWDLAVELCCDELAAQRTDRLTVAAALLSFQRMLLRPSAPAPLMYAFDGCDVALRVRALLQPGAYAPAPRVSLRLWALAAVPLAFVLHELGEFLLLPLVR